MRRLITERDIQQLPPGSKLEVGRDTIVTPSARDLAFARRIAIVEAGSVAASSSAATASIASCSCERCKAGKACGCESAATGPWPKLADGEYLLEVRDGLVRMRRIER